MQMIRIGDYVGVRYNIKSQSDDFEIYNVVKNPEETKNLMNTAKYPETASFARSLQKKMKARVLQVRRPNNSAPRPYDDVPVSSVHVKKAMQGVKWKLYKGKFPWVPQVATLRSVKSGQTAKPNLNMLNGEKNEVIYFMGYLKIPKTGKYTFYLKTDTGAELRIHDATVIDEDYGYRGGVWKQGAIRLQKGLHPFHLYYQRSPKLVSPSMKLQWKKPGQKRTYFGGDKIPAKVFYY
jgi:hypothetical protein